MEHAAPAKAAQTWRAARIVNMNTSDQWDLDSSLISASHSLGTPGKSLYPPEPQAPHLQGGESGDPALYWFARFAVIKGTGWAA